MDRAQKGLAMGQGRVIWITGLSGAGKTTLAKALQTSLPGALLLDGDALREVLDANHASYDCKSRLSLAMTYARLSKLLAEQGATVIVATISLFHAVHAWNRENIPHYLEVFVDVPEHIRRQRDPKGLYAAHEQHGDQAPMAGLDVAVDLPLQPDVHITQQMSVSDACRCIMRKSEAVWKS